MKRESKRNFPCPPGALEIVSNAAGKYGWAATEVPDGIEIRNRKGKFVVKVAFNGPTIDARYIIAYPDGEKLVSGRGVLGKSVDTLIKDYFLGVPV